MMPEVGYNPVNKYLPPRERPAAPIAQTVSDADNVSNVGAGSPGANVGQTQAQSLLGKWLQKQKSAFESLGER